VRKRAGKDACDGRCCTAPITRLLLQLLLLRLVWHVMLLVLLLVHSPQ
jgi:hypothetical protein